MDNVPADDMGLSAVQTKGNKMAFYESVVVYRQDLTESQVKEKGANEMDADNKQDSFEYIMGVINSVGEKNPIRAMPWGTHTRKGIYVRRGNEYSIHDCANGYEYRFTIEKRRGRLTQYRVERSCCFKPLYFALESVPKSDAEKLYKAIERRWQEEQAFKIVHMLSMAKKVEYDAGYTKVLGPGSLYKKPTDVFTVKHDVPVCGVSGVNLYFDKKSNWVFDWAHSWHLPLDLFNMVLKFAEYKIATTKAHLSNRCK